MEECEASEVLPRFIGYDKANISNIETVPLSQSVKQVCVGLWETIADFCAQLADSEGESLSVASTTPTDWDESDFA